MRGESERVVQLELFDGGGASSVRFKRGSKGLALVGMGGSRRWDPKLGRSHFEQNQLMLEFERER